MIILEDVEASLGHGEVKGHVVADAEGIGNVQIGELVEQDVAAVTVVADTHQATLGFHRAQKGEDETGERREGRIMRTREHRGLALRAARHGSQPRIARLGESSTVSAKTHNPCGTAPSFLTAPPLRGQKISQSRRRQLSPEQRSYRVAGRTAASGTLIMHRAGVSRRCRDGHETAEQGKNEKQRLHAILRTSVR